MYKSVALYLGGQTHKTSFTHSALLSTIIFFIFFSVSLGEVNQFLTNNEAGASSVHSWENDSKIRLLTTAGGSGSLGVRRK